MCYKMYIEVREHKTSLGEERLFIRFETNPGERVLSCIRPHGSFRRGAKSNPAGWYVPRSSADVLRKSAATMPECGELEAAIERHISSLVKSPAEMRLVPDEVVDVGDRVHKYADLRELINDRKRHRKSRCLACEEECTMNDIEAVSTHRHNTSSSNCWFYTDSSEQ